MACCEVNNFEKITFDRQIKPIQLKMERDEHHKFMKRAVDLAEEGMNSGKGGPFGAVIVENGNIIADESNAVASTNDPTGHAEIRVIRKACAAKKDFSLKGCTLYTSCEPCPMCFGAIYWARIDRVYYAFSHDDAAKAGFDDSFIYEELKKEHSDQSIPFHEMDKKKYPQVFNHWISKEDKIDY